MRPSKRSDLTSAVLPAIILVAVATGVSAANDSPATLADQSTVVRYKEESVQWTPHSVSVIAAEEFEDTYRRDLEDLESRVPGMIVDRMNTTPRGAAIALRGLGSNHAAKSFDPAVAVKVDGVYVGTHTGRLQVLFDFERIEVTRGPNGARDGNPNLTGSIDIRRAKPTGEMGLRVRASAGIDDRMEADVIFDFPIAEGLNGKISAFRRDGGGAYMKNVLNDRDENTEDYTFLSAALAWDWNDNLALQYTYDFERSDEASPALLNISAPADLLCATTASLPYPNCRRGIGNPELDSLKTTAQNYSNDRSFDGDYHTLRLDLELAGHQFTSITGHRRTEETSAMDMDASNADFYHLNQHQEYDQFCQEFRLERQWSDRLSYQIGAYFLNTEYEIFQEERQILKQLGDAGFSAGRAAGEIQELRSKQKSNLRSAFASATYVLNDQWTADVAARWTDVDRDFEHSPSRIRLGNALSPLRTLIVGTETSKEFLMSGGLAYKVDEEAMIYMRYSEGFLPGGFDENAMSAVAGNSYGAQTTRGAEIGLKSDWWDDRLRVNLAYYRTDLNNKVERFDAMVNGGQIESLLDNIAEVEIAGWEAEVTTIPLEMENLEIRLMYSHINGDYNNYLVPDIANPGATIDLSNLTSAYAPDENLFASAVYSFPYGPGIFRTYAGYRLINDYQTNPILEEADVKIWTAWDVSISYEWEEWVFRLFSNNVKNKEYIQNARQIRQTDILPVAAGRTSVPTLITFTEYNQPRYTGLEVIFTPSLDK